MSTMDEFEPLRQKLEILLEHQVDKRIWTDIVVVHRREVDKAVSGEEPLDRLYGLYKIKEAVYEPGRKRPLAPRRKEMPADRRLKTLTLIAAVEARRDWRLTSFREHALKGRLLARKEVAVWIREHAGDEGAQRALVLRVPLGGAGDYAALSEESSLTEEGPTHLADLVATAIGLQHPQSGPYFLEWSATRCAEWLETLANAIREGEAEAPHEVELGTRLSFWDADTQPGPGFVYTGQSKTLEELRGLAASLTAWIPCREEDAVDFILTDEPPALSKAGMEAGVSKLPALTRLKLTVDPRIPPKDLASFYELGRSEIVRGRDKEMSEKSLALALLVAELVGTEFKWRELRDEWNAAHPSWAYPGHDVPARQFARDARQAYGRVTGRDWEDANKLARGEKYTPPFIALDVLQQGAGPGLSRRPMGGAQRGTMGILERLVGDALEGGDDEGSS